jgi:hypothetical protein
MPRRRPVILGLLAALACLASLGPVSAALAQGSGVGLGSAKKLSSAPPNATTTTSTTTHTATVATHTTASASASSHAKQQQLPFTGANVPAMVIIGGTLLLAGLALRVRTRDGRAG